MSRPPRSDAASTVIAPGSAGGAQVRAFQRIDRDIDFRNFRAVRELGADFLADVKHGRLVAFTLADHDGAAHRNAVHRLAHGLGGDLVAEFAFSLPHGAGRRDRCYFHHAQESRRQVAFNVLSVSAGLAFWTGLRSHGSPSCAPFDAADTRRVETITQSRSGLKGTLDSH